MATETLFGEDRICGVIAATTAREMWQQLSEAVRHTRTVELRLDWLRNDRELRVFLIRLGRARFGRRVTLIATCRRIEAGGNFSKSATRQLAVLRRAIGAGCRWIDLELESVEGSGGFTRGLCTFGARRILSFHDFERTPKKSELGRLSRELERTARAVGFEAVKIATQCNSIGESLHVLRLARGKRNVIAVPMGEMATPARILALREGSALAYAPVEVATAPGQAPLAEMTELYRAGKLDRQTRVYGVIGDPIEHSLSPVLHNTAFAARRVNAVYLPFLVRDLDDFVAAIEPLGLQGFSITLPHKQRILRHLDDSDPLAAEIGAVNTVVLRGRGKLFGYNTDYVGVLRALERRMPIAGSRALIVGAGGVARAVAFALARGGAVVAICARRIERAQKLARAIHGEAIPRQALRREFFDAIVNATPVGMHPHTGDSPLEGRELNCRLVFDTIYRPQRTKLLQLAAGRGIETVSGLDMFLAQGIAQWEIWMGERAPEKTMREAVVAALRREEKGRGEK
ncbi:MAG TPA: shikimate dehydrogenase [Candidatus Acidoferrales bacterium]|nr:shikimate dehydrogenase [Candidatus Acidoferrales bacterium]